MTEAGDRIEELTRRLARAELALDVAQAAAKIRFPYRVIEAR